MFERLGVVALPYAPTTAIAMARAAEQAGMWGVGFGDSPVLYGDLYPTITAVLAATSTIRVGTNVTNPVSRHWTVHSASARTLDALHPGRFFLGLAAGDGAVHTVGLRPATRPDLADAVENIGLNIPTTVPIHLAASGPRMAGLAGTLAETTIIATGTDPGALRTLGEIVRSARPDQPCKVWGLAYLDVVATRADISEARRRAIPIAMSMSHFSLSATFAGKNVPEWLQPSFRTRMERYDFMYHAADGVNPNVALFEDQPDALDYLRDRFCIVGSASECLGRIEATLRDGGLDGMWLATSSHDPVGVVTRLRAGG